MFGQVIAVKSYRYYLPSATCYLRAIFVPMETSECVRRNIELVPWPSSLPIRPTSQRAPAAQPPCQSALPDELLFETRTLEAGSGNASGQSINNIESPKQHRINLGSSWWCLGVRWPLGAKGCEELLVSMRFLTSVWNMADTQRRTAATLTRNQRTLKDTKGH